MFIGKTSVSLAVVVAMFSVTSSARAASIWNGFGANDSLTWGQVGAELEFVSNPFNASSNGGVGVSGGQASGSFQRLDQGTSWGGNFAPGDQLLWTRNGGPITISFATPVQAIGTQVQTDYGDGFAGQIEAFDSLNHSLGIVQFSGFSDGSNDGSAVFAGISSTAFDISSVTIGVTSATGDPNDFVINQLRLMDSSSVVPLPAAAWSGLALLGALGLALRVRRPSRVPA